MLNTQMNVSDIRNLLLSEYKAKNFTIDRTGAKTVEIIGATFLADEDSIIRKPNYSYIERELEWYESMSLFVEDIPGETPAIWKMVSSENGKINSNYGWCVYSSDNGQQYDNVLSELKSNPDSRRAVMIYNRPSMHVDFEKDGMNDFMCTFANTFFIRNGELHSHFVMRSTDAVFGYGNDYAWAKHIQQKLCNDLKEKYPNLECGKIIWTSSNFHVYERHFKFLEKYM